MHRFQIMHLMRLCQKHGFDMQLIDNTLTYEENKKALLSLIPKETKELIKNGDSMEEWYRRERFLTYYLSVRNQEGEST